MEEDQEEIIQRGFYFKMLEESEEDSKKLNKKDLLLEMRMLLNDYPNKVNISLSKETVSIVENLFFVNDLLHYCHIKSKKREIKQQIEEELKYLSILVNMSELRVAFKSYVNKGLFFNKSKILNLINSIIDPNINKILEKLQYYILAIPSKGKPNMFIKHAHGLPAALSEEYESSEIEEGEKVVDGQPFKIEEGKVIAV